MSSNESKETVQKKHFYVIFSSSYQHLKANVLLCFFFVCVKSSKFPLSFALSPSLSLSHPSLADRGPVRVDIQAVLVQLVGPQFGHRRGTVSCLGYTRLLQRAQRRIAIQRGEAHLLRHLQHCPGQHDHGSIPVSID